MTERTDVSIVKTDNGKYLVRVVKHDSVYNTTQVVTLVVCDTVAEVGCVLADTYGNPVTYSPSEYFRKQLGTEPVVD
jgi:hypothetical protein